MVVEFDDSLRLINVGIFHRYDRIGNWNPLRGNRAREEGFAWRLEKFDISVRRKIVRVCGVGG